jgi:hypothetical protein
MQRLKEAMNAFDKSSIKELGSKTGHNSSDEVEMICKGAGQDVSLWLSELRERWSLEDRDLRRKEQPPPRQLAILSSEKGLEETLVTD